LRTLFFESADNLESLRRVEQRAAAAGLLVRDSLSMSKAPEVFSPEGFARELDRRLRTLAERSRIAAHHQKTKQLISELLWSGTITPEEFHVLREITDILNESARAQKVEPGVKAWVARIGPPVLSALDHHQPGPVSGT